MVAQDWIFFHCTLLTSNRKFDDFFISLMSLKHIKLWVLSLKEKKMSFSCLCLLWNSVLKTDDELRTSLIPSRPDINFYDGKNWGSELEMVHVRAASISKWYLRSPQAFGCLLHCSQDHRHCPVSGTLQLWFYHALMSWGEQAWEKTTGPEPNKNGLGKAQSWQDLCF